MSDGNEWDIRIAAYPQAFTELPCVKAGCLEKKAELKTIMDWLSATPGSSEEGYLQMLVLEIAKKYGVKGPRP